MQITSKQNQYAKLIRGLQGRKAREQSGLFVAEGIRWVIEALNHPHLVEQVVVCPALLKSAAAYDALAAAYRDTAIDVLEVSEQVFRSIAVRQNPKGILAVVHQQWTPLEAIPTAGAQLWVALHAVQYPGNLGTILRTCDAVGAAGVILLDHATDPYDPASVRAGVSSIFSQQIVRADLATFAAWQRQSGWAVIGASGDAAQSYREIGYALPLVLLMGSEGEGLNAPQRRLCSDLVSIPMCGRNDSLNVAVAASVILYEIVAQVGHLNGG